MFKRTNCDIDTPVYNDLLVEFMAKKNEIIETFTGVKIFTAGDFCEARSWNEEVCKNILDLLSSNRDRESCPWCLISRSCGECTYGARHLQCGNTGSLYNVIIDRIKNRSKDKYSINALVEIGNLIGETKRKLAKALTNEKVKEEEKNNPIMELYKPLLLLFMKLKNKILFRLTDRNIFNDFDYLEVGEWSEETCKDVIQHLDYKDDAHICPWCIKLQFDCSNCSYGDRRGKCDHPGSRYKRIISDLNSRHELGKIKSVIIICRLVDSFKKFDITLDELKGKSLRIPKL